MRSRGLCLLEGGGGRLELDAGGGASGPGESSVMAARLPHRRPGGGQAGARQAGGRRRRGVDGGRDRVASSPRGEGARSGRTSAGIVTAGRASGRTPMVEDDGHAIVMGGATSWLGGQDGAGRSARRDRGGRSHRPAKANSRPDTRPESQAGGAWGRSLPLVEARGRDEASDGGRKPRERQLLPRGLGRALMKPRSPQRLARHESPLEQGQSAPAGLRLHADDRDFLRRRDV